eukprot:1949079-Prymnesium_polylepis.1
MGAAEVLGVDQFAEPGPTPTTAAAMSSTGADAAKVDWTAVNMKPGANGQVDWNAMAQQAQK